MTDDVIQFPYRPGPDKAELRSMLLESLTDEGFSEAKVDAFLDHIDPVLEDWARAFMADTDLSIPPTEEGVHQLMGVFSDRLWQFLRSLINYLWSEYHRETPGPA